MHNRLDPATDVHSAGLNDGESVRDILRSKAASEENRPAPGEDARELPVPRLAVAAVAVICAGLTAFRRIHQQYCASESIGIQRVELGLAARAHRLDHWAVRQPGNLCTVLRCLVA